MHPTKVTEPWVSAALVTKAHFLVCLSEAIDTLYDPYFHLILWQSSTGYLNHGIFHQFSWGLAYTHSLASLYNDQGFSTSKCFSWLKTVYKARNRAPTRAESQCQPKPFYSQPRQLPCTWHVVNRSAHCPLLDLFASAKPIFKMDHTNWQNTTKVAERCTQF